MSGGPADLASAAAPWRPRLLPTSFTVSSGVRITLEVLTLAWITPLLCIWSRPPATMAPYLATAGAANARWATSSDSRSTPGTNSRTTRKSEPSCPHSMIAGSAGSRMPETRSVFCSTTCAACASAGVMTFTTTWSPSTVEARYARLAGSTPRSRTTWYLPANRRSIITVPSWTDATDGDQTLPAGPCRGPYSSGMPSRAGTISSPRPGRAGRGRRQGCGRTCRPPAGYVGGCGGWGGVAWGWTGSAPRGCGRMTTK